MSYFEEVQIAAEQVIAIMNAKGYRLSFGGEGEVKKKIYVPTDARSEFLANRALGDWAEKSLAAALREAAPAWSVAHYGQSDDISAGDEGFRVFYLGQLELVRKYGKRPDLLVFDSKEVISEYEGFDISMLDFEVLDSLARKALTSIEVRSSKVEALKYMDARRQDRLVGKSNSSTRDTPSFTLKIEDLVIVYRWMERYRLSQSYCQVFFDSVWAINVLDMLRWVVNNKFKVENPDKSQGKATILIPITAGKEIGRFKKVPDQRVHPKVNRLGRHDSYIEPVFEPGNLVLDFNALKQVVLR